MLLPNNSLPNKPSHPSLPLRLQGATERINALVIASNLVGPVQRPTGPQTTDFFDISAGFLGVVTADGPGVQSDCADRVSKQLPDAMIKEEGGRTAATVSDLVNLDGVGIILQGLAHANHGSAVEDHAQCVAASDVAFGGPLGEQSSAEDLGDAVGSAGGEDGGVDRGA